MNRDYYVQQLKAVLTRHHVNHDVEVLWDEQESDDRILTYRQYESILLWVREIFDERCFNLDSEEMRDIEWVMRTFRNVITTGVAVVWPSNDQFYYGGYLPEDVAAEILTIFATMEREVVADGSSHWEQYLPVKGEKMHEHICRP